MKKSEPKTGISIQTISGRNKRPSKYKVIEPSKLEDLAKYQPEKYRLLPVDTLNHLTEHEMVKLVFINREDIWVHVEAVDHEEGTGRAAWPPASPIEAFKQQSLVRLGLLGSSLSRITACQPLGQSRLCDG